MQKHWAAISWHTADGPLVHVCSTVTTADAAIRLATHYGEDKLHPEVFKDAEITYLGKNEI